MIQIETVFIRNLQLLDRGKASFFGGGGLNNFTTGWLRTNLASRAYARLPQPPFGAKVSVMCYSYTIIRIIDYIDIVIDIECS